jgi:two-component system response regulator PilR (NtrC family)
VTLEAMGGVLVVDDEPGMRELLTVVLEKAGHTVVTAHDGPSALAAYDTARSQGEPFDIVLQDVRMTGMDGIDVLRELRASDPEACVVIMTAYSSWKSAVEAMRLGAFDYLRKPFDNREVRTTVQRAITARHAREDRDAGAIWEKVAAMIGHGTAMQDVFNVVRRVAPTDSTICITGESGTGKELIARALHRASTRTAHAFISVNCGAFVETLLESELFGHTRGSFTGAISDRKGLFQVADQGTLFLDEVAEMTPATQVKLLRVLEERSVTPVGSHEAVPLSVRVVAATNKDLEREAQQGQFREDLFYRLNVIPIHLPPLRERRDDIPLLAGQFLARYAQTMGKEVTAFSSVTMDAMLAHDWPGNVRELENRVQRAVALSDGHEIAVDTLMGRPTGAGRAPGLPTLSPTTIPTESFDLTEHLEQVEKQFLKRALEQTGGHATNAAALLGMTFRAFRYKLKKYGLRRDGDDL